MRASGVKLGYDKAIRVNSMNLAGFLKILKNLDVRMLPTGRME
jgi:hypothetical protein